MLAESRLFCRCGSLKSWMCFFEYGYLWRLAYRACVLHSTRRIRWCSVCLFSPGSLA